MIAPTTKGWTCKTCQREVQTYWVTCAQCHQDKWPTLPSPPPAQYNCQLCLSGVNEARRKVASAAPRGPRGKFASKA